MSDALDAARRYRSLGWQPVAAPLRGKSPRGQWKRFQTERATDRDLEDNFARPANVFIITGAISGLVVLDCDNDAALEHWREKIGDDILNSTTSVRTSKGWHFYFKLPEGVEVRNANYDVLGDEAKWDIRGDGGGVIAPPSIHESGHAYRWERGPEHLQPVPDAILEYSSGAGGAGGDSPRSILTHLLQNPPTEGGRNVWLSKVAGHYAKYIPHEDAFSQMVWDANSGLLPPLPVAEVEKLITSIWNTEQAKVGKEIPNLQEDGSDRWRENLRAPSESNGWLVSGGTRILIQAKAGKGDDAHYILSNWMDADIHVLGVVTREEEGDRQDLVYIVEIRYEDGNFREDMLSAGVASDYRKLTEWLAVRDVTFSSPDNASPRRPNDHVRFLRYLKSQKASPMESVEALGWHEDSQAFITHEGVIRPSGLGPFEHVRPEANLRRWAPYRYGFEGTEQKAISLLAEVLTYHDDVVTSVFGSWWAAVLIKPHIQRRASQFPFMALEAASESGKTTGFFSLMMQLAGNHAGHIQPTKASLRDYLSAHRNGIVWLDDLDSLENFGELLRNVTVGGSMVKKGQDNHTQVMATMRAALVVSGESLGLTDQKALTDRAVLLPVPSPVGRKSLKGDYPQWDDVVALTEDHPDLSDYSGTIVQMALRHAGEASELKKLRVGVGRHADTLATLRVGARLLRSMMGEQALGLVDTVDRWVVEQSRTYTGQENALTLKLLPMALANTGWLVRPEPPNDVQRKVATPVFVNHEDGTVWFSPQLLSEWWAREPKGNRRIVERTESKESLEKQARALGLGGAKGVGRKDWKLQGTQKTMRYWRCTPELSVTLIERSRGVNRTEGEDGSAGVEDGAAGDSLEL